MTTLESRYESKIRELQGTEQIEYMLDSIPFIRDHYTTTASPDSSRQEMRGFLEVQRCGNRHDVLQSYLSEVEGLSTGPTRPSESEDWSCECGAGLFLDERNAMQVCPECGKSKVYHTPEYTFDQRQQITKVVVFSYKRMNHFTDWLNQQQGKENKEIPPEILDAVKAEFKKAKITRQCDVTPERVNKFLKKLGLNKYYDNRYSIARDIGGVQPQQLPQYLEDKLKQMFTDIQGPFERAKPPNRKNFFYYGYVLRKFCELLSEDKYSAMFPTLKSPALVKAQDDIWKKVCLEMGWQFIPSV